jgi:hypothetical protein
MAGFENVYAGAGGETLLMEAALQYGESGWRVFPLKPGGKAPPFMYWREEATTDASRIREWWEKWPDANIGMLCGEKFFVVDRDGPVGSQSLAEVGLDESQLGDTWSANSIRPEGGSHYYFAMPEGLTCNHNSLLPKLDTKGRGGYIVAPPSHCSGRRYEWVKGKTPWDVKLGAPPAALIELIRLQEAGKRSGCNDGDGRDVCDGRDGSVGTFIYEGERNDRLFRIGAAMRRHGLSAELIQENLLHLNQSSCVPPLDEQEVEKIAASCGRYDAGDNGSRPRRSLSRANQIVEVARHSITELFHDGEGDCYATVQCGGHQETLRIGSPGFGDWVRRLLYRSTNYIPAKQPLADALAALGAEARFGGGEARKVCSRVGETSGNIYLDLGGEDWKIVEITPGGWRVIDYAECPVRFCRYLNMQPLPMPERGGSIAELRPFVNVSDGEWPLFLGWLVQALRAEGNYPVLPLRGAQGDGKSTLARVIKRLVDPDALELRPAPYDMRDLAAAARNAHVLAFDNLSNLTPPISDALCCLSTGGSFGGRKLYSDHQEAAFSARRPIVVTSITEVVSRPDLLDRAVIISMVPLADKNPLQGEKSRQTEKEFWSRFDQARPRILAVLYDALAAGLRDSPSLKLPFSTRMADFSQWACACLPNIGISKVRFLGAYNFNRRIANETALEASPIADVLKQLAKETEWQGTATDLLKVIRALLGEDAAKQADVPKNGRAMRSALDRIRPNLRADGILIESSRRTNSNRLITIKYKPGC